MQTENYRIVEASPFKDGSKPHFFPEVMVQVYSTKRKWLFWKKVIITDEWHRFISKNESYLYSNEHIKTIALKDISFSNSANVVSFNGITLAQSWVRRYSEEERTRREKNQSQYLKFVSTQLDKEDIKIHEL